MLIEAKQSFVHNKKQEVNETVIPPAQGRSVPRFEGLLYKGFLSDLQKAIKETYQGAFCET